MAGPIKAYTLAVGAGASAIGPSRSRLRSLGIYATAASTFTLQNGNGGATILTGAFPAGYNEVYIPDDGILAENGVYVSAFAGTGGIMTIMLN
tara:strand:- start:4506 stop:4784 length:279 start_codon:yes stop_codon:yes gene_type:complete